MTDLPSLVLATSNGIGMGHLARQLAVGMAATPEANVTLFSLSVALPTVTTDVIRGEYCPAPDRGWVPESQWPQYLARRLQGLAREVSADVVVFDGVAPYRGITLAKERMPETAFVWFRRGMWRPGTNDANLWKSPLFDRIIEPGDLAAGGDAGPTRDREDAMRVPPVSLLEVVEPLKREQAAAELGIDPERETLLLTLGTGRLGDVESPGRAALDAALEHTDWQICVVTSAVARSTIPHTKSERVIELKGVFPLARYLKAFDAAVSAAGYNAVHELLPAGLPAVLVPNRHTKTDDQVARADYLVGRGLALGVEDESNGAISDAIRRLADHRVRGDIRDALAGLAEEEKTGGAARTAEALISIADNFQPQPISLTRRAIRARDEGKAALKRGLGPSGTRLVRGLLGHPQVEAGSRLRVVIDGDPPNPDVRRLSITSHPTTDQLLGEEVVEHVVAGASNGYLTDRRLLIDRFYDLVGPE